MQVRSMFILQKEKRIKKSLIFVHLERAKSLSTEDFFNALRGVVERRGTPCVIWSDYGRNFFGSANILAKFLQKEKEAFLKWSFSRGIAWKFIRARAPHRRGAWETMVKNILRRQLGNAIMTVKQLNTALIEIEAVLNSHPLAPLSPDAFEDAINPSKLITGFNITSLPDPFVDSRYSPSSRWRKLTVILQ
ncbi:uncharacterized protein [Lepeophtheirus salmonis]|uniref:uncharacterized protein n=1 Tax=Lepeophtheirus salmonis TaxID=72036 RepID=UPI001AEA6E6F|nr:uncharacterized protein LOC121128398 [Lepeophtheirus salmonis]